MAVYFLPTHICLHWQRTMLLPEIGKAAHTAFIAILCTTPSGTMIEHSRRISSSKL